MPEVDDVKIPEKTKSKTSEEAIGLHARHFLHISISAMDLMKKTRLTKNSFSNDETNFN